MMSSSSIANRSTTFSSVSWTAVRVAWVWRSAAPCKARRSASSRVTLSACSSAAGRKPAAGATTTSRIVVAGGGAGGRFGGLDGGATGLFEPGKEICDAAFERTERAGIGIGIVEPLGEPLDLILQGIQRSEIGVRLGRRVDLIGEVGHELLETARLRGGLEPIGEARHEIFELRRVDCGWRRLVELVDDLPHHPFERRGIERGCRPFDARGERLVNEIQPLPQFVEMLAAGRI